MRNRLVHVLLGLVLFGLASIVSAAGQVTHALGIEADLLDPHRYVSGGSTTPIFHIFDRLVELRIEPDVHFVPGLATEWETSEDGLRWTFHLRQGVTFHDGTAFDASSVVANFDRILDPDQGTRSYANFANVLEDVVELDQYSVAFDLQAPYAPLLNLLSVSHSSIMSPSSIEEYGEDVAFNPVGTGAFRFVSWVRDERMVLEANDDYWGGRPQLDTLTFIPVIEPATRLIMLERGEVDVIPGIPIELLDRVEGNADLRLLNVPSSRIRLIGINTLVEPLNDVRVRQALNYAVDMETINEVLLSGTKRLVDSPVPPSDFGYSPTFRYEYDPDRARELLTEAGYPDGFTVNFVILLQTRDAGLADVLQAMRDYWADVGIETTVTTVEIAAYSDIVDSDPESDVARNVKHLYAQGFNADAMDADYTLRRSFHCDNWAPISTNRGYYCNSEVDRLLDAAATEMNPEARREIYAEAQQLIMEDAPWVFKYVEPLLFGVRADIEGLITYPQDVLLYHEAYRAE